MLFERSDSTAGLRGKVIEPASTAQGVKEMAATESSKLFKLRFVPFLMGIALLAFYLAYNLPNPTDDLLSDFSKQLTFLGFIVALAAYLASVGRELVKTLNVRNDPKRPDHKLDLGWIVTAEFNLVMLGIFTSARVVLGPTCSQGVCMAGIELLELDFFLVIYLALTIVFLAGLHARQWIYRMPWEI